MPLAEALGRPKAFRLDLDRLSARVRVGGTFDGRDVFAPTAGLLAEGVAPQRLGTPLRPHRYSVPEPHRSAGGARGEVVHEDRFGNLITNIPTEWVPAGTRRVEVLLGRGTTRRLPFGHSYEELHRGRAGCLGSSFGLVGIAVSEGNAARRFLSTVGTPVVAHWTGTPPRSRTSNRKYPRP